MLTQRAIQAELGQIDAELQTNQEGNESDKFRFQQLLTRRARLEKWLAALRTQPRRRPGRRRTA